MSWKYDIVLSDIHVPYFSFKLIKKIIGFVKYNFSSSLNNLYLAGDIIDFAQLSKFNNNPLRIKKLDEDINETKKLLNYLTSKLTFNKIYYIEGNHEKRLQTYIIKNAKQLIYLPILNLSNLLELNQFNIDYITSPGKETFIKTEYNLYVGHFSKYSKMAGRSAQLLMKEKGVNLVQAHTHKIGSSVMTNINGETLEAYECGCLCYIKDTLYTQNPDWQQGFGVIKFNPKNKVFFYRQFMIKQKFGRFYID